MLMKTVHPSATVDTSKPLGLCGTMIATTTERSQNGNIMVTVGNLVLKTRKTVGAGAISMRAFRSPGSNTLKCMLGNGIFCGVRSLGHRAANSSFSITRLSGLPGMNVICDCSGMRTSIVVPFLGGNCRNVVRTNIKGNGVRRGLFPVLRGTHRRNVLMIHSDHIPAKPAALSTRISSGGCRFITSRRLGPRGTHILLVLTLAGAGS